MKHPISATCIAAELYEVQVVQHTSVYTLGKQNEQKLQMDDD